MKTPKQKSETTTVEQNLISIASRDVKEIYEYTLKISKELLSKGDSNEHTP